MSFIKFSCPHCNTSFDLPANTVGQKGNCPKCAVEVTIIPVTSKERFWYVFSNGLDSEKAVRLSTDQVVTCLREGRIGQGAQFQEIGADTSQWISLKDSPFNQVLIDMEEERKVAREEKRVKKAREKEERKWQKEAERVLALEQAKENRKERERIKEEQRIEAEVSRVARQEEKEQRALEKSQAANPGKPIGRRLLVGLAIVAIMVWASFDNTGTISKLNPLGPKVLNVTVKAGDAVITDREDDGLSHLKLKCNNGLVIDCDWERNSFNEFGYDIYEPTVSRDYNRLAVMVLARGVIASYLRGEYD